MARSRYEFGEAQSELLEWYGERKLQVPRGLWRRLLLVSMEFAVARRGKSTDLTELAISAFFGIRSSGISNIASVAPLELFGAARVVSASAMATQLSCRRATTAENQCILGES